MDTSGDQMIQLREEADVQRATYSGLKQTISVHRPWHSVRSTESGTEMVVIGNPPYAKETSVRVPYIAVEAQLTVAMNKLSSVSHDWVQKHFASASSSPGTSGCLTKPIDADEADVTGFIQMLYWLDSYKPRQDLFDWTVKKTDELFSHGKFDQCDRVFAEIDATRLSPSAITALLRSTFMARKRMTNRAAFMQRTAVVNSLKAARSDAEAMIRSLS